jgi:hypothetical protein
MHWTGLNPAPQHNTHNTSMPTRTYSCASPQNMCVQFQPVGFTMQRAGHMHSLTYAHLSHCELQCARQGTLQLHATLAARAHEQGIRCMVSPFFRLIAAALQRTRHPVSPSSQQHTGCVGAFGTSIACPLQHAVLRACAELRTFKHAHELRH